MKCVSALSTLGGTTDAIEDVTGRAAAGLAGTTADLALVFATEHHAGALGTVSERLRDQGIARHVLGCTGESVVGEDREVERSPALSVWAIELPGVDVAPRRLTFQGHELQGWEPIGAGQADPSSSTLVMLGDPFSFPIDHFLKQAAELAPGLRVVGGMASASQVPRGNRLVLDGRVFDDGAVAVGISGPVTVRAVVSQGCRPVGRTMIVTKAEKNVIRELGRRPALEVLQEMFEALPDGDQALVQKGFHIGRVINEYQGSFHRGDFLVRNVLGADDTGGIAITDLIRVGQTVQFHVRDAASADDDLRSLLETANAREGGSAVRGALLFTCNGRGTRLFNTPHHDVNSLHGTLGPVPVAGFFAMGEVGPVGGQNFVHGYTACVVLFEASAEASG